MNKCIAAALFTSVALSCSNANAFDKERNGFLIGLGFGAQNTSTTVSTTNGNTATSDDVSESGTAFSFRIGGGIGRKTTLYFLSQANSDSEATYGLTGLGGTYYFKESGPSLYLHGGVGLGTIVFDEPFVSDGRGGAAMFGIGYEPTRGLHLDLNFMSIQAENSTTFIDPDVDYDIFTTQFMVGYTWF